MSETNKPSNSMTTYLYPIVLFILFCVCSPTNGQTSKPLFPITTLVTGEAAMEAFVRTNEADLIYKNCLPVLKTLKAEGIHTNDLAIYSLAFSIDVQNSAVRMADFPENPDICVLIKFEDEGVFMPRSIYRKYSGNLFVEHFIAKRCKQGSRIIVYILDDDTVSRESWERILKDRVEYKIDDTVFCTKLSRVTHDIGGTLVWLDCHVTLERPDFISIMEFKIPKSTDGRWLADGRIRELYSEDMGVFQFGQMWRADLEKTK